MASLKIAIEDNSPIIVYSSEWRAGHSSDDPQTNRYSQSSFTLTNSKDAFVSFTFNGTGVGIYGAKRLNHGLYQVKLDNTLYPPSNGSMPLKAELFQAPLFTASNLTQGLHTVTVTNQQEESYLDIDFITWETTLGAGVNDKLYVETFQDTSPSFTYLPSETDWGVEPQNLGSFLGGSGHATTKLNASLVYSFDGDGVSLYGPVGPDGSSYIVQVDNGPTSALNTQKEFYVPQRLLYHTSSLGPGTHSLKLMCQPLSPKQTFAVDYATVFTTKAPSYATQRECPSNNGKISSLAIGGIVTSVTALLIISGAMLFWCRRKRRGKCLEPSLNVESYSPRAPRVPPLMYPVQATYLNQDKEEGFGPVEYHAKERLPTLYSTTSRL